MGRIEGHVLIPEEPSSCRITAFEVNPPGRIRRTYLTQTDQEGGFALDVPGGRYLLSCSEGDVLYPGTWPEGHSWPPADTLSVPAGAVLQGIDFRYSRFAVDLLLPQELNGQRFSVELSQPPTPEDPAPDPSYDVYSTVEDGACHAEFRPLRPGVYSLSMHPYTDYWQRFWLPFGADPLRADTLHLAPCASRSFSASLDHLPSVLRGSIRGSWQYLGFSAPRILAFDSDSSQLAERVVDLSGAYALRPFLAERVRLGYSFDTSIRWIGGLTFDEATEYDVTGGGTIEVEPVLEGAVLNWLSPEESLAVRVPVISVFTPEGRLVCEEQAAGWSRHPLALPGLTTGDYLLALRPWSPGTEEWIPQWYDGAVDRGSATPVHIEAAGEVVPVTWHLTRGGVIRMRVWNSTTHFSVIAADAARPELVAASDRFDPSSGEFYVSGLPDGSYKVGVLVSWCSGCRIPGPLPQDVFFYPGAVSWDDGEVLSIVKAGTISDLEMTLP